MDSIITVAGLAQAPIVTAAGSHAVHGDHHFPGRTNVPVPLTG